MEKFINADALKLKFSVESTEAISERATDETFVAFCKGIEKIALRTIDEMQPADVQEAKHGRWREEIDYMTCSACHKYVCRYGDDGLSQELEFLFCPCCGARMDGKKQ